MRGLLLARTLQYHSISHELQARSISEWAKLTFGMLVAQCLLPHVCQLDRALAARVHEPVAAYGMEFSCRDDLRELLHVRWLDVDNIEALVLDIEVPEVDSQVV